MVKLSLPLLLLGMSAVSTTVAFNPPTSLFSRHQRHAAQQQQGLRMVQSASVGTSGNKKPSLEVAPASASESRAKAAPQQETAPSQDPVSKGRRRPSKKDKRVYLLDEGNKDMKMTLGGKGANLCEMKRLGLPVPPAFILTTACCAEYFEQGSQGLPVGLKEEYLPALRNVEEALGRNFGDPNNPLLVSVRSGAPASMPGMMDTVLNLGMNDDILAGIIRNTGNGKFAYDIYRRFIMMYSNVILGMDMEPFEEVIMEQKEAEGVSLDVELSENGWKTVVEKFKILSPDIPYEPMDQLEAAITAVFRSWHNKRAVRYRALNNIPSDWGTAVTVQSMVYGTANQESGTGVAFSRNPSSGKPEFFGEFLPQGAGEDVVAGIRTPEPIENMRIKWPHIYDELFGYQEMLESYYRDMQDMEFTVENGKLFMLQTRNGKRTPKAAVRIAVDMVNEGMLSEREGLLRIPAEQMDFFLHSSLDPKSPRTKIGKGLPASPGAATGKIAFTADEAEAMSAAGDKVVLVRRDTSPDDINAFHCSEGILTSAGGMTSHAAVVARGMGTPCVSGCADLVDIDVEKKVATFADGTVLTENSIITLDGSTGEVFAGTVGRLPPGEDDDFLTVLNWADSARKLKVMANADTPKNAADARELGAEGIGLCRTEHMFFGEDRILAMRSMIMADTDEERQQALDVLFEYQRQDIGNMLSEMDGLPMTVRLLDPPLHEFLPHKEDDILALADMLGKSPAEIRARAEELAEVNPMLGFRGVRLGIIYPEITRMQCRAIAAAAADCKKRGQNPMPEVMVPLTVHVKELDHMLPEMRDAMDEVFEKEGVQVPYKLGSMLELPRACLIADDIAKRVDFLSIGSNDLTQATFGFSRDDASRFIPTYMEKGILMHDPFVTVDEVGVGELVEIAVDKSQEVQPGIKFGVCGEHGGDPKSVRFWHSIGCGYVSCSPFRVPIARIAAGQAAAEQEQAAEEEAMRLALLEQMKRKY
jgi:pyruvate,orthophosphate dikinase